MTYLMLTYLDEKKWFALSQAEKKMHMQECMPHIEQLCASGMFLGGSPLEPTWTGATIRARDGKTLVTDGPYAETREQVGGYTLIEARDREEAIAIASGFMGTNNLVTIEVRALAPVGEIPTH